MTEDLLYSDIYGNIEGFNIRFDAIVEYDGPEGHFCSGDDKADSEIIRKINAGEYVWFTAKVSAWKSGVKLASSYLGGCCYSDYDEFINEKDYFGDMVEEVVAEAKAKIKGLGAS